MTYGYICIVWLVLLTLAILNGIIREKVYQPWAGEQTAHVISTALFVTEVWMTVGVFLWLLPDVPAYPRLWAIGACWAAATVIFEFLFGHYVAGHSWARLGHDYNVFKGRVWVFVLISLLVAPPVLGALMRD